MNPEKTRITREDLVKARTEGQELLQKSRPLDLIIADIPEMVRAAMARGELYVCVYFSIGIDGSEHHKWPYPQSLLEWCKGWCTEMGDEFWSEHFGICNDHYPIVIGWTERRPT